MADFRVLACRSPNEALIANRQISHCVSPTDRDIYARSLLLERPLFLLLYTSRCTTVQDHAFYKLYRSHCSYFAIKTLVESHPITILYHSLHHFFRPSPRLFSSDQTPQHTILWQSPQPACGSVLDPKINKKNLRKAYTALSGSLRTLMSSTRRHVQLSPFPSSEGEIGVPNWSSATVIGDPIRYFQGTYGSSASTSLSVEMATAALTTYFTSSPSDVPLVDAPVEQPSYAASAAASDLLYSPPKQPSASDGTNDTALFTINTLTPSEMISTLAGVSPTTTPIQISTSPLSALHAPKEASTTLKASKITASSTAPLSAATFPPWHGSTQCAQISECEKATNTEDHRGKIAGPVLGVVGFLGLLFAGWVLCHRCRQWRKQKNIEDSTISSDRETRKTGSQSSTSHTNDNSIDHAITNQARARSRQRPPNLLGEPGPALLTNSALESGYQKTVLYPVALNLNGSYCRDHRVSESTRSNASVASDPFITPIETNRGLSLNMPQPTPSSIGLALTQYSTTETSHAKIIPHPPPLPKLVVPTPTFATRHTPFPIIPPLQEPPRTTLPAPLPSNRTSTLSTRTTPNDTEEPEPTVSTARIVTTRRHSFTPRIINIIAGQHSKDAAHSDSTDSGPFVHRVLSTRARSVSPQKASYSGSPAKLNAHFGIETWGMPAGRTASEMAGYKRAGSKESVSGRKADREQRGGGGGGEKYPPSSYPKLGRTLSAVKRTIRAEKEGAFSGTGTGTSLLGRGTEKDGEESQVNVIISRGRNGRGGAGTVNA